MKVFRNLLNIGIFLVEILLLVFVAPALIRFFLPMIVGWLIAQLANPLVRFWKGICILCAGTALLGLSLALFF